jgi:hypothetical protein
MDGRYHLAKLIARAFNDPPSLWAEHDEVRRAMLAPYQPQPEPMSDQKFMDAVARIHRKLQTAGLRQPDSGEMH